MALDLLSAALVLAGCFFFGAGTVGILRFPDLNNRLHALVKADNLGLGLVLAGLALQGSLAVAAKLVLIWLLALLAASTSSFLLADRPPRTAEGGEGPDGHVGTGGPGSAAEVDDRAET
ncbi:MAG TPA: monovalent cation/H(+) antiporter subunit G [Beutenbergiaceae bacterium]|nr:monovalent cation/H(+) antiporter subunit G [Beutenbergiaceae bacterium]